MSDTQEFADFEIEQDFNTVKEWDGAYNNVPPGDYSLDVVMVENDTAKSSGNPQIKVTFKVADEGTELGKTLWGYYSLSQKAIGRLKQLMMAAGCNLDKFRASELMGSRIMATVVHTQGEAKVGTDGNPMEAKTFANVQNERAIEQPKTSTAAAKPAASKAPAPPIASGKPAANNARRA